MRRLRRLIPFVREHPTTFVGISIVLLSTLGAFVTWRAATASGAASDFEQRARQARVLDEQIRGQLRGIVAYEEGLFRRYRERLALADELDRERLVSAADTERAVARSLQMLVTAQQVVTDSKPRYDGPGSFRFLVKENTELEDLQPDELESAADSARDRRFWLVFVDTGLIAAIFCLTMALLGAALRRGWAIAGGVVAVAAVISLALVQLLVVVPSA